MVGFIFAERRAFGAVEIMLLRPLLPTHVLVHHRQIKL